MTFLVYPITARLGLIILFILLNCLPNFICSEIHNLIQQNKGEVQ